MTGGVILVMEPRMQAHPLAAAIGCAVIGATGVFELFSSGEAWLGIEEALSCMAAIGIVAFGEGRVTAITLVWLTAAAVGVLARGGRAGGLARLLVTGALLAPVVLQGRLTGQDLGLIVSALALLLAVGRVSRETAGLLRDPLTEAVSRGAFRAQVDRMGARAREQRPVALIMVDFDDFGTINKQRGYAAGDALLKTAACAMQSALHPGDVLGRMGGDEFAVLTAERNPEATAARIAGGAAGAGISACAGVARAPADGRSAEELMSAADFALRMAKRAGKGRVVTYDGASLAGEDPAGARRHLQELCAGEHLALVLQPVVDLRERDVVAYEALPALGAGGHDDPVLWFTLADTLGMRAALEQACLREAMSLMDGRPHVEMLGLKLSASTLTRREVQASLLECRQLQRLMLELTQEPMLDGDAELQGFLAEIRRRGARVAVDGVGAGHADLGQLALIAPDYLRLDRSALRGCDRESSRSDFLRAIAAHARRSGRSVVADGIETEAELLALLAAGVVLGQGPLFASEGLLGPPPAIAPVPVCSCAAHAPASGCGCEERPAAEPARRRARAAAVSPGG